MNNLINNGYKIFRNELNNDEINILLSSIHNNQKLINYTKMKNFIDNIIINKINNKFNWNSHYCKFRFSNNNNSTDASTFHSDIYNFNNNINIIPIYTCILYLDNSNIQIIPDSHKNNVKKNNSWLKMYNKKKILDINIGDIMIFNANLHHRGINYSKKSRRILQIFEIFPNKNIYNLYYPNFYTILTSNINKNNKFITYEPGKRIHIINKTYQPINLNIINNNNIKLINPNYNNKYLLNIIILLLLLLIFNLIIFYYVLITKF